LFKIVFRFLFCVASTHFKPSTECESSHFKSKKKTIFKINFFNFLTLNRLLGKNRLFIDLSASKIDLIGHSGPLNLAPCKEAAQMLLWSGVGSLIYRQVPLKIRQPECIFYRHFGLKNRLFSTSLELFLI